MVKRCLGSGLDEGVPSLPSRFRAERIERERFLERMGRTVSEREREGARERNAGGGL